METADELVKDINDRFNVTFTIIIFFMFFLDYFLRIYKNDATLPDNIVKYGSLVFLYLIAYVFFVWSKKGIAEKLSLAKFTRLLLEINLLIFGVITFYMGFIKVVDSWNNLLEVIVSNFMNFLTFTAILIIPFVLIIFFIYFYVIGKKKKR
jgi:hypothetical protein